MLGARLRQRDALHALGRPGRAGRADQGAARQDAIRVVIVNSGNANAATGNRGFEQAARTQGAAAMAGGVREDQVAVASTGVIGVQLDAGDIIRGIARARGELREYGHGDFSEAIQTTDKFAKEVEVDVALPSGTVRLTAQAKGAGMISPELRDDAVLRADGRGARGGFADCCSALCVERSFDRISVDGQLSTNDTVILQASGGSGVSWSRTPRTTTRFGEALDWALRKLALDIVRDGEGSKRIGRVVVRGGSDNVVETAARAIANSPLVKAALHGGDPNWGRIVAGRRRRADRHRAARGGRVHRERAGVRGGHGDPVRRRRAGRGGRRGRGRVRRRAPGRAAPRPRSSSPTSRTST